MIQFTARILRKQDDLPRYIIVPREQLGERNTAFCATVYLGADHRFERNIRPWGRGSDLFFFNLTAEQCRKAGVDTNDKVAVKIVPDEEGSSA